MRRAFLPPKNLLAGILRRVDNTIALVLQKVSFGLIRLSKRSELPGDRPVAWRETAKTSLGSLRYQFYLSFAISLLMLCIFAVLANDRGGGRGRRPYEEELMAIYFIFLTFVALHVVVKSASMFAGERSRQTLDILLTTPMSNREIVTQKFSSVFLTMAVYLPPFLVLLVCDSWIKEVKWASYFDGRSIEFNPYFSALASLITVAIYLPMLAWLSLLIGLRVRNQIRAIIASLVVIVAWGMIPIFTVVLCQKLFGSGPQHGPPLAAISSPIIFLEHIQD